MSQTRIPVIPVPAAVADTAAVLVPVMASDDAAFRSFYQEWNGRLHGVILRVLRDPAQTEEVVQEVFFELWSRPGRFQPERGTAAGFLFRLARSRAIDRVRASQTHRDYTLLAGTRHYYAATGELSRVHEDWSVRYDLQQSLNTLTVLQREVVELVYFSDLTHTAIATHLGVPVGTVKSRIASALTALRRQHAALERAS